MRIGRSLLAMFAAATLSLPVWAAPQLLAPASVRDLLERFLSLTDPDGEPRDDAARAALERRLRTQASELLATEGYFSPQVELRGNNGSDLVLQIEPGPRAHIGSVNIDIRGAVSAERRQQLIDGWTLPSTAPFRQTAWNEAKQGLLRELLAVDHAAARLLSSKADVDVEAARVDLQLVYDTGPRYVYGEIRILGLKRYPERLVERYSERLQPGQPFQRNDLLAVQTALQNTPFFSSVSVELELNAGPPGTGEDTVATPATTVLAVPGNEVQRVPVIVRLRERDPFRVSLGGGYSTNTGARVEGNFRNADFFNQAWELNTGARLEQLRQSAYADIFFPPDRLQRRDSVGTVYEKTDIEGLKTEGVAFAVARTQSIGSIEQRLGLNWQYEEQSPEGAPSSINRALTATVNWVWRHAEDPLDASEGIVARLRLGLAAKALLSDQSYLYSYFRYSQGIPLSKTDALLLRGEVGATAASSSQGIPQDYLFRAGGTNSVRGYHWQSLGVKEGAAVVGGRYLLTLSAEYTRWLDPHWGVATFIDAGQAGDDLHAFKLAQGYGFGARWRSPVGPLAVDVAWGQLDKTALLSFSLAIPF